MILFLLAAAEDQGLSGFVQKYFSFIVLGLVLSVGYVFVRLFGGKKKEAGTSLEDAFHEAQKEIRSGPVSQVAIREDPPAHVEAAPSPPPPVKNLEPEQLPPDEA